MESLKNDKEWKHIILERPGYKCALGVAKE
jgi:hypothetical protein